MYRRSTCRCLLRRILDRNHVNRRLCLARYARSELSEAWGFLRTRKRLGLFPEVFFWRLENIWKMVIVDRGLASFFGLGFYPLAENFRHYLSVREMVKFPRFT